MSWQHTEIHTNCIYDFKHIMILLIFSHNCQALRRRKMLVTARDKDLGNLVCFNKYLLGAYCMQGTVESQIIPFPSPIKKKKHLKNMSWYSKKNTIQYMASLATENPQFDSTLSRGIISRLSVSGKEAVMEILTTDHFTQLIVSCKHRNQFFLWRCNLNGFINAEWRTTASRSVKLPSIHFQPFIAKHVWARLTPTLGQVPPSNKKRFFRRLRLSGNQSAEPDKYFFSVCRSNHSWRPHDITGQRCRFCNYESRGEWAALKQRTWKWRTAWMYTCTPVCRGRAGQEGVNLPC